MNISIIVPIYNSEKFLSSFFEALLENTFFSGDEVLLIDNGSTDDSYNICKKYSDNNAVFKLLTYTEKAGSYAARNYGVKQANGDVLVFTDSDTEPCKEWLSAIRSIIQRKIVIAGRIQLDIIDKKGIWENFDSIAHLNSEKNAKESSIATANMAVYRSDFEEVGFFEERFSGGDYEWSQRAAANGMKIVFVRDALVHHPTRKTFEQVLKKEQRIAYGTGNHYKIHNKSLFCLVLRFCLKIFKIDTNLRYSKALKDRGLTIGELLYFNAKFMKIRVEQLKFSIYGYKEIDARKLVIK